MTSNRALKAIALLVAGAGLAYGGYRAGTHHGMPAAMPGTDAASGEGNDPKSGRRVLYWHDPMVPGQKFDKPGKSPFMDMQLVPVYAGEDGAEGGVRISPAMQQNLGIRFATVRREQTRETFDLIGTTQFDESMSELVQSRVTGYIDRLYARAPMQRIKRGEPIALLFVPDWIAPQEEYLALKRSGNEALAAAARQRMQALSIPAGLVAQAERSGQAQKSMTLASPVDGVVTELAVRDGAMVTPGMTIAKVAGLARVWLVAELPEASAGSARPGMTVDAAPSGNPTRTYRGKVREILPGVNASTRTVQARLELDNRDGSLTPGMLMRVRIGAEQPVSRLLVRTEAVIRTGQRTVVLVAAGNGDMQPVMVTTGRDTGDDTEILSGLQEGQKVVASGQFLIDSEASLKSVLPRFAQAAQAQVQAQSGPSAAEPTSPSLSPVYRGVGKVEKASPQSLTLSHRPIPELKWPAMTMDFGKPSASDFADIEVGQEVEFSFKESKDGYVLLTVVPAARGRK
jgi:Cu(I)/Ag(I) efflux system membrane fusion protein